MECQRCGSPATVHVVQTVGPKKREVRLCDACAKAADLLPATGAELNLPALVGLLMGLPAAGGLECPDCGLSYAGFRADGRLGCPGEYDAFRPALEPLLERIHRATRHAGKRPRRVERGRLRSELAEAVAGERYEEAARLRDALRAAEGETGG
jgi:protein arginine kinase activator